MDVNEQAVKQALQKVDILIHGHITSPVVQRQIMKKKRKSRWLWLNDNSVNVVIGVKCRSN